MVRNHEPGGETLKNRVSGKTQRVRHTSPADNTVPSLRPSNLTGFGYLLFGTATTLLALWLSLSPSVGLWLSGQVLLALSLIQWFALLHEAGHKTLFRSRTMNSLVIHLAGFIAIIPGDCWRLVHAKHHYWTGWQDLDMTTESLSPRSRSRFERWIVNVCWALWIPLFASLYRINNYWNLFRLWRLFRKPRERLKICLNIGLYGILFLTILWSIPESVLIRCFALALWLSFALQDLLILSQHTHIPLKLSQGQEVAPITPPDQDQFTRSLEFPEWISRFWLLNMDAHSLHHMYPYVPGYQLHHLNHNVAHKTPWWRWVWKAKTIPGDVLLFQNRDQTGFYF